MEELVSFLETFTSTNNDQLKNTLEQLSSSIDDPNFYHALLLIILNDNMAFNIRFSAIIYFKNCILHKWQELSEITSQSIHELFFTSLINFDEPRFFPYILQISDLLVRYGIDSDWITLFEFLCKSDTPLSSFILLRSLILHYERINLLSILPISLQNLFSLLQNGSIEPIYMKLFFSIIRRSLLFYNFEDVQLQFLIGIMMTNIQNEVFLKFLPIFTSISRSNPELMSQIHQPLVSAIIPRMGMPKVPIKFFPLFASFAQNDELWKPFSESFIQLFLPFFVVQEADIIDPVSFITQHFFDSFSSETDPNSAAFKCLEIISQYQYSAILVVLGYLKQAFESKNQCLIYSASHMASGVLKNINYRDNLEKMNEFFNGIFEYLNSESILVKSASLILLSFETYLSSYNPIHVQNGIRLILHPDEIISFFSINCINKLHFESLHQLTPAFLAYPIDALITRIYHISQKFEVPTFTDLLSFLLGDPNYLTQAIPYIFDIVNSAFMSIHFYAENDSSSTLVSSLFNIIITLLATLATVQSQDLLQFCKFVFVKCLEIDNPYFYGPIFEVLFLSIYHSPESFEEMFTVYDSLFPLIKDSSEISKEMIFKIFSIVLLKNGAEFIQNQSQFFNSLASVVINQFDPSDFSVFIGILLKNNIIDSELISLLLSRIYLAWKSDETSFFDGLFELLTVIFTTSPVMFLEVLNDDLHEFLSDLIESADDKELMMILPYIFNLLLEDQQLKSLEILQGIDNFEEEENEYISTTLTMPQISIYSNLEILQNYSNFLSSFK